MAAGGLYLDYALCTFDLEPIGNIGLASLTKMRGPSFVWGLCGASPFGEGFWLHTSRGQPRGDIASAIENSPTDFDICGTSALRTPCCKRARLLMKLDSENFVGDQLFRVDMNHIPYLRCFLLVEQRNHARRHPVKRVLSR
jgi:hypothetical protein